MYWSHFSEVMCKNTILSKNAAGQTQYFERILHFQREMCGKRSELYMWFKDWPLIKIIFEGRRTILKERAFQQCIATWGSVFVRQSLCLRYGRHHLVPVPELIRCLTLTLFECVFLSAKKIYQLLTNDQSWTVFFQYDLSKGKYGIEPVSYGMLPNGFS